MKSYLSSTKDRNFQGPRIQVTAITTLIPCIINKKNVTFVKSNFKLLVLLSNCWASAPKKSTRNLREGVTAWIKDQPILFIDKNWPQTISSITIFFGWASLLVVLRSWENQKFRRGTESRLAEVYCRNLYFISLGIFRKYIFWKTI
jgi:hypothetical protein